MMIGPSAPNGPPLPMAMAEERGLSTATFGDILLLPNRIASIASGMPCPPNGLAAIASDQSDHQAADHGNHDHPETERVASGRATDERQGLEEEEVGEEVDQVEQDICRDRAQRADHYRDGRDAQQVSIRCKITS